MATSSSTSSMDATAPPLVRAVDNPAPESRSNTTELVRELEQISFAIDNSAIGDIKMLSPVQRMQVVELTETTMDIRERSYGGSDPTARQVNRILEPHQMAAMGLSRSLAAHDGRGQGNPFQNSALKRAYDSERAHRFPESENAALIEPSKSNAHKASPAPIDAGVSDRQQNALKAPEHAGPALMGDAERARSRSDESVVGAARSSAPGPAASSAYSETDKKASRKATGVATKRQAAPASASESSRRSTGTSTSLKSPSKQSGKPSLTNTAPQPVAAPQPQSKATASPSMPIARPPISSASRPYAGDREREAAPKETVQPKKNPEKDVAPKKRPEEEKEHPYTKGRLSTMKAIRHVAVHLATGFIGGSLLNARLENRAVRKDSPAAAPGAGCQEGTNRVVNTRTGMSPRQQQQLRISRATAQAAEKPATISATNRQSPARRAADSQAELIGRPKQQARIKRAPLQAGPVKAKGRGR